MSVFGTVFGEKDDFKVRFGQKTSFFLSNMGANRFPKILVFFGPFLLLNLSFEKMIFCYVSTVKLVF